MALTSRQYGIISDQHKRLEDELVKMRSSYDSVKHQVRFNNKKMMVHMKTTDNKALIVSPVLDLLILRRSKS